MAYCVQADIEARLSAARLVELADDDKDGVADAVVLAGVIADGDAVIDSYVGTRYEVPITAPVPDVIKRLSVQLAIFNLADRRGLGDIEQYRQKNRDAITELKDISAGRATLGIEPTKTESMYTGGAVLDEEDEETSVGRRFTRETLKNF